jgi:hypothetical protein
MVASFVSTTTPSKIKRSQIRSDKIYYEVQDKVIEISALAEILEEEEHLFIQ